MAKTTPARKRNDPGARTAQDVDALVDEMGEESFPASDAPQLDGVTRDRPARNAVARHPGTHPPPPDVAPAGDDAALDLREGHEDVLVGQLDVVTASRLLRGAVHNALG